MKAPLILLVTAVVGIQTGLSSPSARLSPRSSVGPQNELIEQAKRLIVIVEVRYGDIPMRAAGIVMGVRAVEGDFIVATARHAIEQSGIRADSVMLRSFDAPDETREARILDLEDKDRDLVFLAMDSLGESERSLPWNRLGRTSGLVFGDGLYTIGHHHGKEWLHNSQLDAFTDGDGVFFRFDSSLVDSGASGGGVFNREWNLVGMVLGSAEGARARALGMDWIREFLREQKVELRSGLGISTTPQPLPDPDPISEPLEAGTAPLALGEKIAGEIPERAVAPQAYEFTVPTHGLLTVSLENKNKAGTSNSKIASLHVLDSYGNKMGEVHGGHLQAGSPEASCLPVSVQAGQIYRTEVVPIAQTARIAFTIVARFEPFGHEDPYEPNGSARDAARLRGGTSIRTLVGQGYDREDWYRIQARRTGTMVVTVQNLSPNKVQHAALSTVWIYDETDMTLRTEISQGHLQPGSPAKASLPMTVEEGRAYVVRVAAKDSQSATAYLLGTALQPFPIQDLGEPNNAYAEVTEIAAVGTYDALVGTGSDVRDCYAVTPDRSGSLTVELANKNPARTKFGNLGSVIVTDESGTQVGKIPLGQLVAGNPPASVTISVEKGRRYIIYVEPAKAAHIVRYVLQTSLS